LSQQLHDYRRPGTLPAQTTLCPDRCTDGNCNTHADGDPDRVPISLTLIDGQPDADCHAHSGDAIRYADEYARQHADTHSDTEFHSGAAHGDLYADAHRDGCPAHCHVDQHAGADGDLHTDSYIDFYAHSFLLRPIALDGANCGNAARYRMSGGLRG
jgi:hypothetical protein